MATTELSLAMLGTMAALCSLVLVLNADRPTTVVLSFVGAMLWGLFGLSAFDVLVLDTYAATKSEPILPLVYMGIGLSIVVGMFWLLQLVKLLTDETDATEADGFMP